MLKEFTSISMNNNLANPIGPYLATRVPKDLTPQMLNQRIFQVRYELLVEVVCASNLVIENPTPPNDVCLLFTYPSGVSSAQLSEQMDSYVRFMRAHAARLRADIAKLTIS